MHDSYLTPLLLCAPQLAASAAGTERSVEAPTMSPTLATHRRFTLFAVKATADSAAFPEECTI
ncbi:hypothetical protein GCM10029978_005650 [Actinoallomurus acanthiterrae]